MFLFLFRPLISMASDKSNVDDCATDDDDLLFSDFSIDLITTKHVIIINIVPHNGD